VIIHLSVHGRHRDSAKSAWDVQRYTAASVANQAYKHDAQVAFTQGRQLTPQRRIVGATNPLESDPGSVRGQYAVSVGYGLQLFDIALHL
jgi:hypothetical protein